MAGIHHISKVCGAKDAVLDVIFVHGLTGSPDETWTAGDKEEYWPCWLCADFPTIAVHAVGYPASLFEKWAKKEMNLHEKANNLLENLAAHGFGKRPIVFVSHSLGGILVKEILRVSKECADEGWHLIIKQTRLVLFLATPHTGSSLASAVRYIVPRLSSSFVDLLTNDSGYLTSLNQAYREAASAYSISTVSYYEKWKTKDLAIVTTIESADPGVGLSRPVAVDADHVTIATPEDRESLIYLSICRHLNSLLPFCTTLDANGISAFDADDYSTASGTDRRDLLQKLIDAGREHEYQMANDYQNKFAQRYNQLGLLTEAKLQSDALLASVHQRFLTHVYVEQICRHASPDKIAAAVQDHVIDPLCNREHGGAKPSATAILQALYFLTEQCYIRWDAQ